MKKTIVRLMAPVVWLAVVMATFAFLGIGLVAQTIMGRRPVYN
jgi:heme exporter protein D